MEIKMEVCPQQGLEMDIQQNVYLLGKSLNTLKDLRKT